MSVMFNWYLRNARTTCTWGYGCLQRGTNRWGTEAADETDSGDSTVDSIE